MDVTVTPYKRCDLVKLSGRLDSDTTDGVEEVFESILKSGTHKIVLDMTEVSFVSSKGWWLLIGTQKKCKHGRGELVLACLDDKIRKSLNLVGMNAYFQIFDDITAAVGHF